MSIPTTDLGNGLSIPNVGFGLWKNKDEAECIASVEMALKAGYTHFDTAQAYDNEQFLAAGLKKAGVDRKDVFITTKIKVENFLRVEKSFAKSLENLDTDYVDLLLLHFPVTVLRHNAWKKVEAIHKAGQAKSIGVSNYMIRHLEHLLKDCEIKPAVNQVELHVFLQQPELVKYCQDNGIVVEAYSPLAHGKGLDDPVLAEIGKKHGKTSTQIMLRWCIEVGTIPLPKSTHEDRIQQNIDIFDFELDEEDMAKIKGIERNLRTCWDPTHII
ncbi:MAG: aldo/keto reductase [Candidatus Saccharibacteria bacterium]|nr:aldo/keto reductase [Candidatus Saccharibacteria bacterium]